MRTVTLLAFAFCCLPGAWAMEVGPSTATLRSVLAEQIPSVMFAYERESLTAVVEVRFHRGSLRFGIANPLELPEVELPPGSNLADSTLLADELSGFDVDAGNERLITLELGFRW